MNNSDLTKMSISQLVDHFAEIGMAQRHALENDNLKLFKKLYDDMDAINKELRAHGNEARLVLLRLMNHPDIQVRLQAAKFGYGADPEAARACIQAIADSKIFPQAGTAGISIEFLENGTSRLD